MSESHKERRDHEADSSRVHATGDATDSRPASETEFTLEQLAELQREFNAWLADRTPRRCADCRHWEGRGERVVDPLRTDLGRCDRIELPGSGVVISTVDPSPHLLTRADFGCVQWERQAVDAVRDDPQL